VEIDENEYAFMPWEFAENLKIHSFVKTNSSSKTVVIVSFFA